MGTERPPVAVTEIERAAAGGACYVAGTAIATEAGETPIEVLAIGDIVRTASDTLRPVKWIGHRRYAGRFLATNPQLLPIRFQAGALGEGLPHRDLLVSPKHALFIDGRLVAAERLVNDSTIAQDTAIADLAYFHLELDTHDIILAEGVPAETFTDDGSRGLFHNAPEYRALYPGEAAAPPRYCAPFLGEGDALASIRRRLAALAAAAQAGSPLEGFIDTIEGGRITGWARDPNALGTPVQLLITDHETALGEVVARQFRADLANPGVSHGCHGFEFTAPEGLSPAVSHSIAVRRAADGRHLQQSPYWIDAGAAPPPPDETAELRGQLDMATRNGISGWAQDAGSGAAVMLVVLDNDVPLARVLANRYRPDLHAAGVGSGAYGFNLAIPGGLSPLERHVIAVQRESDGTPLPFSPMVIDAASSFDAALEQTLAAAVDEAEPGGEQIRILSVLMTQAERLLQRAADADGMRAERRAWHDYRRRWGPKLDEARAAADPGLRALVIDMVLPVAGRDAGSASILSHMTALQQLHYAVALVAADDMATASPALAAAGIKLCTVPLYASVEEVLRRQADCFDVVYLRHASIAMRYVHLARRHQKRARILVGLPELLHRRWERRAEAEMNPLLIETSRRLLAMECSAAAAADVVLTHSPAEAALLRRAVPSAQIHCVPWHIPPLSGRPAVAKRQGVAFIGDYGNPANVDAAFWLAETIMPLVWADLPGLPCLLAGSAMPAAIKNLARPGITPLGHVADLATLFDQARVTVAPMRYGAGICGKVLESLAAGVPCVMTPIAADGIKLPPPLQKLVAPDAGRLAGLIRDYHQDLSINREAARAGLSMIRTACSGTAVTAGLQAAIMAQAAEAERLPA